jgi:hypothetical protein
LWKVSWGNEWTYSYFTLSQSCGHSRRQWENCKETGNDWFTAVPCLSRRTMF